MTSLYFDSVPDYGQFISESIRIQSANNRAVTCSLDNANGFTFYDTVDAAKKGGLWIDGARNLARVEYKDDAAFYQTVKRFECGPVGFMPNIPAYLAGTPDSMITQTKARAPSKILSICVNSSRPGTVGDNETLNRGKAILSTIDALETVGYQIELWALVGAQKHGKQLTTYVKVKSTNEPLNLSVCAFAFCSNFFLRRLFFRQIECSSEYAFLSHEVYGFPPKLTDKEAAQFDVYLPAMEGNAGWRYPDEARARIFDEITNQIKAAQ